MFTTVLPKNACCCISLLALNFIIFSTNYFNRIIWTCAF